MDESIKKVYTRYEKNIQIVILKGRMTYDYIGDYKDIIKEQIKEAEGYVIDLRGVEQIDSTGLGLLVNIAKHFISNKNKMVIVNTDVLIGELFEVSKLNLVFEICDSMEKALRIVEDKDNSFWSKVAMY